MSLDSDAKSIGDFAKNSVTLTLKYLNINTEIVNSSTIFKNNSLKAQERIIDICKQTNTTEYFNLSGGKEIYTSADFEKQNLKLSFIEMQNITYSNYSEQFSPYLSVIDMLAHCSKEEINDKLLSYKLTSN